MKLPYFIHYLTFGFVLLGVAGCGAVLPLPGPDRLRLVAVTAVNSKDEASINDYRPQIVLKFSLSSNTDIAGYAIDHGMSIGNKKYFCDRRKPNQLAFSGYVYWRKYEVGHDNREILSSEAVAQERAHTSSFIYDIYEKTLPFKPEEKDTSSGSEDYTKDFNFWEKPEDVCLQINGADRALGFVYFITNTVRVPKEAIKAALYDYRRQHPNFIPLPDSFN